MAVKENQLHLAFSAWLTKNGYPFYHCRTDQRATISVGLPDYCVLRNGNAALVEFKAGKGKLTPAQVKCHANLKAAGCPVKVARSLEEAISHIVSVLGEKRAGEAIATSDEPIPAVLQGRQEPCPKFYLGKWQGQEYVFAKDLEGKWSMIRKASPADMINLLPMGL